jgi:hypothetical protein
MVEDEVSEEVAMNSRIAQPGATAFWLNGVMLSDTDMNPFAYVSWYGCAFESC